MNKYNPKANASGYPDPTAFEAITKVCQEQDERCHKVISLIRKLCDITGFDIQGRIVLVDKKTGRVFR